MRMGLRRLTKVARQATQAPEQTLLQRQPTEQLNAQNRLNPKPIQLTNDLSLQKREQAMNFGHNLSQISFRSHLPKIQPQKQKVRERPSSAGKYAPQFVDLDDIEQAAVGNSHYLSEMIFLAQSNPDAVERFIRPKGQGLYEVTINVSSGKLGSPSIPKVLIVDDTLPASSQSQALFNQEGDVSPPEEQLWVMLIEKAYAIYAGSYSETEGSNPGIGLEMLTRNNSDIYTADKYNNKQVAKILNHALLHELPVRALTKSDKLLIETAHQVNPNLEASRLYGVSRIDVDGLKIDLIGGTNGINDLSISDFRQFYAKFQIGRA